MLLSILYVKKITKNDRRNITLIVFTLKITRWLQTTVYNRACFEKQYRELNIPLRCKFEIPTLCRNVKTQTRCCAFFYFFFIFLYLLSLLPLDTFLGSFHRYTRLQVQWIFRLFGVPARLIFIGGTDRSIIIVDEKLQSSRNDKNWHRFAKQIVPLTNDTGGFRLKLKPAE